MKMDSNILIFGWRHEGELAAAQTIGINGEQTKFSGNAP